MPDDSYARLLGMDVARTSAPDSGVGLKFLEGRHRRWVKAGHDYGLADAYTAKHVYVLIRTGPGVYIHHWYLAEVVHSVAVEDWRGIPLED